MAANHRDPGEPERQVRVAYTLTHTRMGGGWWVSLQQPGWDAQTYGPYPTEDAAVHVKLGLLQVLEGELVGPFEREPAAPYLTRDTRRALLARHLVGVEVGAYDRRILDWLAGGDTSTALVVVGLLARARAAGPPPAPQGGGRR
jgi:hypothetical protein